MQNTQKQNIRKALATLASTHATVVEQMENMIAVLTRLLEVDEVDGATSWAAENANSRDLPIADHTTLSVDWRGKSCFLGNTLLFWFFERIVRTPNQYVSHIDLLDDVWGGPRETATIRGLAKRLRDRLIESDMKELGDAIDGSVPGYYGLILV